MAATLFGSGLLIPAPESPCASAMGMKGAILIGDGRGRTTRTNGLDADSAMPYTGTRRPTRATGTCSLPASLKWSGVQSIAGRADSAD
jgi:hypothetical protein